MVLMISGSAVKQRPYGRVEAADCPQCRSRQPARRMAVYRRHHVWYLIRWVSERHYARQCQTCGHAELIPKREAQRGFKRPGIGFWDRWAWAVVLAVLLVMVAVGKQGDAADHERYRQLLAQPAVGDLYEIDLAKVMPDPQAPVMAAIVRVDRVEDGKVVVRLPRVFQDRFGYKLYPAIQPGGEAHTAAYFGPDTFTLNRADLPGLEQAGTIVAVER